MTQLSVTIPDNKLDFFVELLQNLGFASIEPMETGSLTDAQKAILDQRLENYKTNPESYIDWKTVQTEIESRL